MTDAHMSVSFLDLPDLSSLTEAYPELACLVADPVLNHERLWVVGPSRVSHSLFGASIAGVPFRPTVPELVHRGIIRGMGIERRWRDGLYIYSSLVRLRKPVSGLPALTMPYMDTSRWSHSTRTRCASNGHKHATSSPIPCVRAPLLLPERRSTTLVFFRTVCPLPLRMSLRRSSRPSADCAGRSSATASRTS